MARYKRTYSKAIITKAPKKSWNTGTVVSAYDILTFNGADNAICSTMVSNDADNANPTPTVIKAKHLRVFGTVCLQGNATQAGPATPVSVMSYIMYIPQIVYSQITGASQSVSGLYNVLTTLVNDHPEWIMSTKNVNVKFQGGFPGEHDITKFTQGSGAMERNLKSGDKICHIMTFRNLTALTNYNRSLYFTYNFTTCVN